MTVPVPAQAQVHTIPAAAAARLRELDRTVGQRMAALRQQFEHEAHLVVLGMGLDPDAQPVVDVKAGTVTVPEQPKAAETPTTPEMLKEASKA